VSAGGVQESEADVAVEDATTGEPGADAGTSLAADVEKAPQQTPLLAITRKK
jgi:hypothetical protein